MSFFNLIVREKNGGKCLGFNDDTNTGLDFRSKYCCCVLLTL